MPTYGGQAKKRGGCELDPTLRPAAKCRRAIGLRLILVDGLILMLRRNINVEYSRTRDLLFLTFKKTVNVAHIPLSFQRYLRLQLRHLENDSYSPYGIP